MRTVGIVVEYNPLHNGHVYHFEQSVIASEADACVAVMSGHFLQRGEPAVVNKWARTEMALRMGADLVIELPVAYSSQPAEWFAYGAVSLLHATGVVDTLCFGSEDGRIEPLLQMAGQLYQESDAFRALLKEELKKGGSYPAAYAAAASAYRDGDAVLTEEDSPSLQMDQPNNILGLHYLMALRRLGSPIVPLTIPRQKAGYHQATVTDASIASATAIRKLIFGVREGMSPDADMWAAIAPYVPAYTLQILRREYEAGRGPLSWENYAQPLFSQLLGRSAEELEALSEVTEGLEHRLKRVLRDFPKETSQPVESLLQLLKTKRYTRAKLQRTLLRVLLQHPKHELTRQKLSEGPSCLRVLGFTEKGRELLRRMKKTAKLPVITKVTQETQPLLDMDIRATSIYSTAYAAQSPEAWLRDYYEAPIRI